MTQNLRIAIIGAGPAGVSLAAQLRPLSHLKVDLFEASGDVGGQSDPHIVVGVKVELGTAYLTSGYRTMKDLARKSAAPPSTTTAFAFSGNMWVVVQRLGLLAILLLCACSDKGDRPEEAYEDCAAGYPGEDECDTFDVHRYDEVDAAVDCASSRLCDDGYSLEEFRDYYDTCVANGIVAWEEIRSDPTAECDDYDPCAVAMCTRERDCRYLTALDRVFSGDMGVEEWCDLTRRSPEECSEPGAYAECDYPTSG